MCNCFFLQEIEKEKKMIYEDPHLKNHLYQLHAIIVHKGSPIKGHYWAYIYNTDRSVWQKFDDSIVSETSLDDLKKEAVGGLKTSTSAYSLVYINANGGQLSRVFGAETSPGSTGEALPEHLETFVHDDNKVAGGKRTNG